MIEHKHIIEAQRTHFFFLHQGRDDYKATTEHLDIFRSDLSILSDRYVYVNINKVLGRGHFGFCIKNIYKTILLQMNC